MFVRVVDASVLGAFAFGEPRADEAANLLANAGLHAPDLLPYELSSIALKKSRLYPTMVDQIARALDAVLSMPVSLEQIRAREVFSLAFKTGLSVYDASYLQLAHNLKCSLVTFDNRLGRLAMR